MNRNHANWAAWAVVMGMLCVGSAEAAPPTDAQKCEAAKTSAAGKHAACLLKVNAKLVATGQVVTPTSYDKCNEKISKAWLNAETKYGVECPTSADEAGMTSLIQAMAVYLSDHLAGPVDSCTLAEAEAGLAACTVTDCSGTPTDTLSDTANCGSCGNVCSNAGATPACTNGVCTIGSCDLGFLDCNSSAADGCEVFAVTDVSNCGGCGQACSLPNAVEGCSFGVCGVSSCDVGYGDCDGLPANGCEASLTGDPNNCGSCASVCSLPNAQENCTGGVCGVQSCDVSYANCNGSEADGCEANLNSSPGNCGICGNVCSLPNVSSHVCNAGSCGIGTCSVGYLNCNGMNVDGCEVGINSDPSNCGSCGMVCPGGTPNCSGGTCVP